MWCPVGDQLLRHFQVQVTYSIYLEIMSTSPLPHHIRRKSLYNTMWLYLTICAHCAGRSVAGGKHRKIVALDVVNKFEVIKEIKNY